MNVCGVVETASWRELPDAILLAWFPGQECGDAVADLLTGRVSPSGRLPMTFRCAMRIFPRRRTTPMSDRPRDGTSTTRSTRRISGWGYRYFTTARHEVAYPFGYGLSVCVVRLRRPEIRRRGQGWELSVTVRNTGRRAGREVVQLTSRHPKPDTPSRRPSCGPSPRRACCSPAGEERVTLRFTDYDLASFDQARSQWRTDRGAYVARLGRSAEETILTVPFRSGAARSWRVRNLLAPAGPITPMQVERAR